MAKAVFRLVEFRDKIFGGADLEFVRAKVPAEERLPFAMVYVSIKGKEQPLAFRLDLDKAVFVDHLEDVKMEYVLQKSAPRIIEFLRGSRLHGWNERAGS